MRINQVKQFIIDQFLFGEAGNLTDDLLLLENGVLDSTGVLELIGFLEGTFKFKVEDTELLPENLNSLNRITAFLEKKLGPEAV